MISEPPSGALSLPRVLIVGAGPAGMEVALCCYEFGLSPVIIDCEEAGGLLRFSEWPMSSALGFLGETGKEVAARMVSHIEREKIPIFKGRAAAIEPTGQRLFIDGDLNPLPYDALVIATGVRFRGGELPGECEAAKTSLSWISYHPPLSPQACLKSAMTGEKIVILGGGDNAFSTAIAEAQADENRQIIIALRSNEPSAHPRLILEAENHLNIALRTQYHAVKITSSPSKKIHFKTAEGEEILSCDRAYIHYGYRANSEWCSEVIKLRGDGFISVDEEFQTSVPKVWAIGEVVGPAAPSVATVIAHGVVAAQSIERTLRKECRLDESLCRMKKR